MDKEGALPPLDHIVRPQRHQRLIPMQIRVVQIGEAQKGRTDQEHRQRDKLPVQVWTWDDKGRLGGEKKITKYQE